MYSRPPQPCGHLVRQNRGRQLVNENMISAEVRQAHLPSVRLASTVALAAFVLFLVSVYGRPREIVSELRGATIALVMMSISGVLRAATLLFGGFQVTACDLYVCAFGLTATLSLPFHGWFGGSLLVLQKLGPSLLGYCL